VKKKISQLSASFRRFFVRQPDHILETVLTSVLVVSLVAASYISYRWVMDRQRFQQVQSDLSQQKEQLAGQLQDVSNQLAAVQKELTDLKNTDQFKKNVALETEIKNIQTTYNAAVVSYEKVLHLRDGGAKTQPLDAQFALVLTQLSKNNYASASATLVQLNSKIDALTASLSASGAIPANLKNSNSPPSSGYSQQVVQSDTGSYVVDILAADLNSTRVQVETASPGDCGNNCPVDSLASFVSKSGGYAGINGPYFCPTEYPSCAGKTNSFDTLLMNKNKVYFNSANNVYSTVPAMIFNGNSVRLVGQSLEWGRDTGVDAVIAAQPLLVSGGNVAFGGNSDPKETSNVSRAFIASKDNFVYIGVVHGATVAQVTHVLKTLGVQSALNLDSSGSLAFMVNGKYVDNITSCIRLHNLL